MRRAQKSEAIHNIGKKNGSLKTKLLKLKPLLKVLSNYSGGIPLSSRSSPSRTQNAPISSHNQSIYYVLPSTTSIYYALPSQDDGRHQGALLFHLLWGAKTFQQGIYICLAGWALLLILMDLWRSHAIWTDFSMPIYVNMAESLYVRIGFTMLIGRKMVWILLAWHHG